MRDWILDKMRRRSRRGPNDSESTGKSGQELPSGQLAPLRPDYPEPEPLRQPASSRPELRKSAKSPAVLAWQSAPGKSAAAAPSALTATPVHSFQWTLNRWAHAWNVFSSCQVSNRALCAYSHPQPVPKPPGRLKILLRFARVDRSVYPRL